MTKSKLAIIIDNITITIIFFVVSFLWINKYIKNAIFSFILSILLSIALFVIIFIHSSKKHNILSFKNKELKFAEKCFNELLFSNKTTTINYFEKLLNAKHHSNNIYENEQSYFYVNIKLPLTNIDFISANDFYLETEKSKPLCFICKSCDKTFENLLSDSPINYKLYSSAELFELMKETNTYPIASNEDNKKHIDLKKVKNKFFSSLNKKQFKNFLISGLSLIVISIFIPYSYYYLFFGSLLLVFAVICLFNKQTSPTVQKNELKNYVKSQNQITSKNTQK